MKYKTTTVNERPRRCWVLLALGMAWISLAGGLAPPRAWSQQDPLREQAVQARVTQAGYTALAEDRVDRAIRIFEQAVERWPDNLQTRFGLGTAYIKLGRYADAIELLEAILEAQPDEFFVMNNLGWLYATATDPAYRDGDKAVALAQQALLIEQNNYHIWSTLAEGHFVAGNFQRSGRAAFQALRLAQAQNASRERIIEYRRQVRRAQQAVQAFTILD